MRRAIGILLLLAALVALAFALSPHELTVSRTVGHQGRAARLRKIDEPPEKRGPRLCDEGEKPSDDDPCIVATERADFVR